MRRDYFIRKMVLFLGEYGEEYCYKPDDLCSLSDWMVHSWPARHPSLLEMKPTSKIDGFDEAKGTNKIRKNFNQGYGTSIMARSI
jgi:hypothetical protein